MALLRKASTLAAATVVAFSAAAPVHAQDGALWRDEKGRQMSADFLGGDAPPPLAADRDMTEMAAFFMRVCAATEGAPEAVKAAAADLALTDKSFAMPMGKNADPLPLVIARGDGVVVAQAERFLSNKHRQCNVIFYTVSAPDMAALEQTFETTMGSPAGNAGERLKKNGKPNPWYTPEWTTTGASGRAALITFAPIPSFGGSDQNGVQFSLLSIPEERK